MKRRRTRSIPDHETTGESVVLENDLMNNTGARLPETSTVFVAGRGEEVENFLIRREFLNLKS